MLSFPKIPKLGQIAVAGLIVLLPLSFFCYQAWFNPRIEFLVPSFKSQWILHSHDSLFPEKLSGTVIFRRRFNLTAVPQQAMLAVRAATQFRISVNGQIVEPDSQHIARNWKFVRNYDIAPFLVNSSNTIEIRVTNTQGLPALMVRTLSRESQLNISSDTKWESALEPDLSKWRKCRYPYQEPPVFGQNKSAIQQSPAFPVYFVSLIAFALFIIVAIKPWHLFSKSPRVDSPLEEGFPRDKHINAASRFPKSAGAIFFSIALIVILAINIHNVMSYPYSRSYFDYEAHVDYIRYMASNWRVPLVTQGWEMYQPPLYYFISAVVYTLMGGEQAEPGSLKAIQALGMLSTLACLLCSWLILRICLKGEKSMHRVGLCIIAFMPMILYLSPTISNEVFSAAVISLALYLLMKYGFRDSISIGHAAILGVAFGLAMLSKYTAFLFFLIAIGVFVLRLWMRSGQRRREGAALLIFMIIASSICGWFYVRNTVLFHNPFVGNWDAESGFNVEQFPGYRTLGFYSKFGTVFVRTPERSRWSSFWDAYYGSMWMDTHFNMIDYRDTKASSYGTLVLGLALLPSAAILVGFFRSLQRIANRREFHPELALVAAVLACMLSMIFFSLRVPSITTLKAFFSLSLLPAFAVFSAAGLSEMAKNVKKFSPLLYIFLFALVALIIHLFWYRPF